MPKPDIKLAESPIEVIAFNELSKYFRDGLYWTMQEQIGPYRVDFFAAFNGGLTVIECDGKDFHDFDDDRKRDIDLILKHGVTQVVRFRGSDLMLQPHLCVSFLRNACPHLFGDNPALDFSELCDLSRKLSSRTDCPILRCAFPGDTPCLTAPFANRCIDICYVSGGRAVVEFKSPRWSRVYQGDDSSPLSSHLISEIWSLDEKRERKVARSHD